MKIKKYFLSLLIGATASHSVPVMTFWTVTR